MSESLNFYFTLGAFVIIVSALIYFCVVPLVRKLLKLDWGNIFTVGFSLFVMILIGTLAFLLISGIGWVTTKGLGLQ